MARRARAARPRITVSVRSGSTKYAARMPQAEPSQDALGALQEQGGAVLAVQRVQDGQQAGDAERPDRVVHVAQPQTDEQIAEDDCHGDRGRARHQVRDGSGAHRAGDRSGHSQSTAVDDVAAGAGGAAHHEGGDHRPCPVVGEEQVARGEGRGHCGGELHGQPGLGLKALAGPRGAAPSGRAWRRPEPPARLPPPPGVRPVPG